MTSVHKTKILHLMGSPVQTFDYELSMFYGSKNIRAGYDKINGYEYMFAIIHPGGEWSFPIDIADEHPQRFKLSEALKIIDSMSPDIVLCHLFCSKTSSYLSLFELLGIPCIGATADIFNTVTNKAASRGLMMASGLPVPQGVLVDESADPASLDLRYPCVVKPTNTENSLGLSLVHSREELQPALNLAFEHGPQCIIEKFINGREVRTGCIETASGDIIPLPCIQYKIPYNDVRRFEDKLETSEKGKVELSRKVVIEFISEAKEPELVAELQRLTVSNHRALKCRDFSLLDCRVTEKGEVFILECNVFGSLSPSSIMNRMWRQTERTDAELMDIMVKNALKRACTV